MKRFIFLTVILFTIVLNAFEYKAELTPPQAFIGDILTLHFQAELSEGKDLVYQQEEKDAEGNWQILDVKEFRSQLKSGSKYNLEMKLACFDTAWQSFAPRHFILKDENLESEDWESVQTDSFYVYINSALDSIGGQIPDQYGPRSVNVFTRKQFLLLIVLVIAAFAAFYFAFTRKKNNLAKREEITLTDLQIYLKAIEALRQSELIMKGEFKDFFEELAGIIKTYLESEFFIHLRELSTREMLPVIKTYLDDNVYDEFKQFMDQADMVKYAGQESGIVMCQEALEWAESLGGREITQKFIDI